MQNPYIKTSAPLIQLFPLDSETTRSDLRVQSFNSNYISVSIGLKTGKWLGIDSVLWISNQIHTKHFNAQ